MNMNFSMENTMKIKIAIATADGENINEHFGRCRVFSIFEVDEHEAAYLEIREVVDIKDDSEEVTRIDSRIDAIADCAIVYCTDIGGGAAARVIRRKIHPIKVKEVVSIKQEMERFPQVMANPPIWIRKLLAQNLHINQEDG
jgi:nitrogen fixation protein NifX